MSTLQKVQETARYIQVKLPKNQKKELTNTTAVAIPGPRIMVLSSYYITKSIVASKMQLKESCFISLDLVEE